MEISFVVIFSLNKAISATDSSLKPAKASIVVGHRENTSSSCSLNVYHTNNIECHVNIESVDFSSFCKFFNM